MEIELLINVDPAPGGPSRSDAAPGRLQAVVRVLQLRLGACQAGRQLITLRLELVTQVLLEHAYTPII
jgi:hypothetical protein